MRILAPDKFTPMPWANGRGVSREIARAEDGSGPIWRLALADVPEGGPFSAFPGLTRILTVVSGAGLVLRGQDGVIEATSLHPVRFAGDPPVSAELIAGPVTAFNLIFDAARVTARVSVLRGPFEVEGRSPGHTLAFLKLSGRAAAAGAPVPDGAVALGLGALSLAEGARGILVRLSPG